MCRPRIPERRVVWLAFASVNRIDVQPAQTRSCRPTARQPLSSFGQGYLAGLLAHARAATVFTTPTINGYKRYRSYSLAPDRAIWGRDNRGAMLRVLGGAGDSGDAASKIASASPPPIPISICRRRSCRVSTASIRKLDPGPSADTPYETNADLLPKSLREATFALKEDPFFREKMGATMVDYYTHIKNAEIDRFQAEVSDWEQREYFEMF